MGKNDHQWFLTKVINAIKDYQMIEAGDRIAIGLSGGKDSMVLLYVLAELQKYKSFNFQLYAINIDLGFNNDFSSVNDYCHQLQLPLRIEKTAIAEIVFNYRREANPCALCAKLRRGALVNAAKQLKCNKIALGHHGDDAVETLLLNIIHEAKMATFAPRTDFMDNGITIIRPLIYLNEKTTQAIGKVKHLPIVKNRCPIDGKTERQEIKELFNLWENAQPDIRNKFIAALRNSQEAELWKNR